MRRIHSLSQVYECQYVTREYNNTDQSLIPFSVSPASINIFSAHMIAVPTSGMLSNDNTHTGMTFLSRLTRIQRNKSQCNPATSLVLSKYLDKFSKPKLGDDVTEVDESAEDDLKGGEVEGEEAAEHSEGDEGNVRERVTIDNVDA